VAKESGSQCTGKIRVRYEIDSVTDVPSKGIIMRRPNRGIFPMDVALSLSHNHSTGLTCALLLGCSELQVISILRQLRVFASLAGHPLLLPTMITDYIRTLLENLAERSWIDLLGVEHESGQTGLRLYDEYGPLPPGKCDDYVEITKSVLGIIQLSLSWENYVKTLILAIESIQESLVHVNSVTSDTITPDTRKENVSSIGVILEERLQLNSHISKLLQSRLHFITQRTQAQMTAVRNPTSFQQCTRSETV
jgi:hypothetical protein